MALPKNRSNFTAVAVGAPAPGVSASEQVYYDRNGNVVVDVQQGAIADLDGADSTTQELHDKVDEILTALRNYGVIAE